METEPILPYADRSVRLIFQRFWSAEDTQTTYGAECATLIPLLLALLQHPTGQENVPQHGDLRLGKVGFLA